MGPMTIGDHAVVLGGSMAGLLAARVLAEAPGGSPWWSATCCHAWLGIGAGCPRGDTCTPSARGSGS